MIAAFRGNGKIRIQVKLPNVKGMSGSPVSYRVKEVGFKRIVSYLSLVNYRANQFATVTELNGYLPKGQLNVIEFMPVKLLPKNDLLYLLEKTGTLKYFLKHFDDVAFCSCIKTLDHKNNWEEASGLSFYRDIEYEGLRLSRRTLFFNAAIRGGNINIDLADLFQVVVHETGHMEYYDNCKITDRVFQEMMAYNFERNALLRLRKLMVEKRSDLVDISIINSRISNAQKLLLEEIKKTENNAPDYLARPFYLPIEIKVIKPGN